MSDPSASTSAEQASKTQSPPPVAIFKKKGRTRPAAARQRSPSPSSTSTSTPTGPGASSSEPSGSAVSRPSKKAVYNPLIQGTKRKTRLEDDTLEDWADDGVDVNWKSSGKNKADNTNYVTESLDWDADALEEKENAKRAKLVEVSASERAVPTRWVGQDASVPWPRLGWLHPPIYPALAHDSNEELRDIPWIRRRPMPWFRRLCLSRLIGGKRRMLTLRVFQAALNDGIPDDGMYHGAAAYKTHLEKRVDGPSNKMKAGPQKASSNIRQITIVDYQPDVCKDYKGEFFFSFFFL